MIFVSKYLIWKLQESEIVKRPLKLNSSVTLTVLNKFCQGQYFWCIFILLWYGQLYILTCSLFFKYFQHVFSYYLVCSILLLHPAHTTTYTLQTMHTCGTNDKDQNKALSNDCFPAYRSTSTQRALVSFYHLEMETPQAIFTHRVLEPAGDRRILRKKASWFNWENRRKHKFYCH